MSFAVGVQTGNTSLKKQLVPYNPNRVPVFHGTRRDRGETAVSEQRLSSSQNVYDWLGHGIYFWESSTRAYQWAETKYGREGVVVRTEVLLGHCLDLFDPNWAPMVKHAYESVKRTYTADGKRLPENRGGYRPLDCLVMNELAGNLVEVDTIRAPFLEGEPVYPTSILVGLSHVQVTVRNPNAIIRPLEIV